MEVIQEAKRRFALHISGQQLLPADLRTCAYRAAVNYGSLADYEAVLNIFRKSDLAEEKMRALRCLAGVTENVELLNRTFQLSLTEVRTQDILYVFAATTSKTAREFAWKFFRDNFDAYQQKMSASLSLMENVVKYAIDGFTGEQKAHEIESFFKDHPVPSAERAIKQALESIRGSGKWVDTNRESVAKWLAQQ